jgi:hypothetical protein
MSKNPDLVNMQYTSFASKDAYKPPTTAFFNQGANAKKPKYVPGGEWAADDDSFAPKANAGPTHAPASHQTAPNVDADLQRTGQSGDVGEAKPKSKFPFIQKKSEATSSDANRTNSIGVLEYSELTSDK